MAVAPTDEPAPHDPATPEKPKRGFGDFKIEILIAAIGVIGACLGAFSAGWFNLEATQRTIASNADLEFKKFQRERREKAYLDHIDDVDRLNAKAAAIANALDNYGNPDYPWEFNDKVGEYQVVYEETRRSGRLVDLVGSRRVRASTEQVLRIGSQMNTLAANALDPWYDKTRDRRDDIASFRADYMAQFSNIHLTVQELVNEARSDLGAAEEDE